MKPRIYDAMIRIWRRKQTHYVSTIAGLALALAVVTAFARSEGQQIVSGVRPAEQAVPASPVRSENVVYLVSTQAQAEQAWAIERYINELRHYGFLEQPARSAVVLQASGDGDGAALRGLVELESRILDGLGGRVTVNDWLAD